MNDTTIAMLERLLEMVTAVRDMVDELLDMASRDSGEICSENESTRKITTDGEKNDEDYA